MRTGAAAVALVLQSLILAPAAFARPALWVGSYRISVLSGFENTSWTLNHVPASPCDAPATGSGTDQTTFGGGKPITTEIAGLRGRTPNFDLATLPLAWTETRQGAITAGTPADSNPVDCGQTETLVPPGAPDCGVTHERTRIDVNLDPLAPALVQHYTGVHFDSPYVDCPAAGVVAPQFAAPLTAHVPPLGPASAGGTRSAIASLTATQPIASPGYTGSTQLELRMVLTRLAVVAAMQMPGAAHPAVGRSGRLTLPLRCPPPGPCRGTVSLSVGVSTAPVPYPLAPSGKGYGVAEASFSMRSGERGVTLTLPGGRRFAARLAGTRVDAVISEQSGHRIVTYDAGVVHL